jgi:type IX secretion system PorP/SprF family membrane protein
MNKTLPIFLIVWLAGCLNLAAQQDPLYSQYLNNPMVLNPAYAGINDNLNLSVAYRHQWAGFDGNPTTFNFNGHISLLENRLGAGLLVVRDQIGSVANTEIQAAFAYKLKLDDKILSFGMQAGMVNFRSNVDKINPFDQNDPVFLANENVTKPNVGAGMILRSDRYLLGLSVPRLLGTTIDVTDSNGSQELELYKQHFYFFGSYVIFLNENIRLKPATLLRAVGGSPLSVDLNFNLVLNERHSAGLFTRNFNSYGIILQTNFSDKYRLGYTFELPTNRSVGTQFNTHELFLGMKLSVFDFHDRSSVNAF